MGCVQWDGDEPCVGKTDLFFQPDGERVKAFRARVAAAKALCADCSKRVVCRDMARENRDTGIWGGETELERYLAGFPPQAGLQSVWPGVQSSNRRNGGIQVPFQEASEVNVDLLPPMQKVFRSEPVVPQV